MNIQHRRLVEVIHGPLTNFVSNVFGADQNVDDGLLTKIVDVWTGAAQSMISSGCRQVSGYINDYSSEAWTQLRDTEQRRKLTPYFFSRIIEWTSVDIVETGILRSWLVSLVEREAMLKYQSRLTSTLLARYSGERLLRNPPFSRDASGRYNISLHDFRTRRLSLISTVLCNMRESFDEALYNRPSNVQELRRTYAELLRHLMQAMKENYQDLQVSQTGEVANAQVQGAYAEFVQHIVSVMQQYTAEIQQIDRFFTDSAAFPLPATDPTYVVGRLRSYVLRLAETKKRNQLAIFVQSVSERAAVDGQQSYLVNQLTTAMVDTIERGNQRLPSLRQVLLTAIFPAYIEQALSTAFAWVVALPILQACGHIVSDLLYNMIPEDNSSVHGVVCTLGTLLHSMATPLELALVHPGQLRLPQAQAILSAIFTTAQNCLTCVRSFNDITQEIASLKVTMNRYEAFAECIEAHLTDADEFDLLDMPEKVPDALCPWPDTLDFARRQIRDKLNDQWYASDGLCYVKRGLSSVEVNVSLHDEEDEQRKLLQKLRGYRESYRRVFDGSGRRYEEAERVNSMLKDLVV